jgi:hypothetical protein
MSSFETQIPIFSIVLRVADFFPEALPVVDDASPGDQRCHDRLQPWPS